ncbi:MAG TPA: thioredoxin domain-containing protein [Acidobacteriaceae bacterium]|nr:thioredoxin domain-containing protein [Acidobacteriaceae bacterium]
MADLETPTKPLNALARARSSYLRSAMHQPIRWQEWGPDAFAQAAREDKPVLLDIGAVWCHWCHVMDRESYEDETLAPLINERFVAVKVDRDERPDVDSRYQAAVQAVSGQGGWPLTAVLTPDGRPFFGGTYFPRHDRYGRPGIERLLLTMSDAWQSKRDEVMESASSIIAAIEHGEAFAGRSGLLSSALADKLVHSAIVQFDPHNGGFGAQPKFPHPAALDLLLDTATRKGDAKAREVALVTLTKMADGGIYDHVGGGFHRYSVDERWLVPHFEKMLYDNAGLLANYVHAWQSFPYPVFSNVVRETVAWMDGWLSDREKGGFYGSQDADMTLDDDGDYFTWTRAEAAEVLSADELEVAGTYYDIGELGDMHHNPAKNVLHIQQPLELLGKNLNREPAELTGLLATARAKLATARAARPTPYVDRTVYTGWNAMAISAYLQASSVLQVPGTREFATKTLDRILTEAWSEQDGLAHVVAYAAGEHGERIPAVLDDYALLVHACLDAWEGTLELRYYEAAARLAARMQRDFYDATGGGFFDAVADPNAIGALSARRKPLQDTPTPAGNPTAAAALLRLEALNGDAKLREMAEDTLEAFAGVVEHFGLYAGSYGLALERLLNPPQQIVVVGEDDLADALESAARSGYAINKTVLRATAAVLREGALPPVLRETLTKLPQLQEQASFAVVCQGTTCLPPVRTMEELQSAIATRA